MQSVKYRFIIVITVLPTQVRYMFQLVKGRSSGHSVQKCTQRKAILIEMSLYICKKEVHLIWTFRYFAYIFVLFQMRMALLAETCGSVHTGYFDLQLKETNRQIFVRCSSYPAAGVFIARSRTTLPLPAAMAAESCVCPDRTWRPPSLLSNEYHVLCKFGTHPVPCIKSTKVSTDLGITQLPV